MMTFSSITISRVFFTLYHIHCYSLPGKAWVRNYKPPNVKWNVIINFNVLLFIIISLILKQVITCVASLTVKLLIYMHHGKTRIALHILNVTKFTSYLNSFLVAVSGSFHFYWHYSLKLNIWEELFFFQTEQSVWNIPVEMSAVSCQHIKQSGRVKSPKYNSFQGLQNKNKSLHRLTIRSLFTLKFHHKVLMI